MWYPTLSTTHADDTPVNGNVYQQRFDVDVKANRKLEELAQGLVLAASHDTIGVAERVYLEPFHWSEASLT